MSYEVLARRYRPQSFEEVAGQAHVTTALRHALLRDRLPHALLLAGPRGTGKTSIARILALSLNCDEGPTDKPCGRCAACYEIAASRSLDVQEIDAASHTGVDSVREIRDNVRYAAAGGKHRIFIIDEVHMLSQAAFNALLKTLEEPPPRSLFILATTDAQKIPATVLSRVQRFDLKRLGRAEQLDRLREIALAEELVVSDAVLRALVRESDGSLRDALTLLDRLASAVGGAIEEADAAAVLDLVERRLVVEVTDAVLAGRAADALAAVRRATLAGVDAARLAGELLAELRDLLVARLVDEPAELVDAGPEEVEDLQRRAKPHDPEALQRAFRVLLVRVQELAAAPRPDHALEMAVVRLATLPRAEAIGALVQRLEALSAPDGGAADGGAAGGGAPGGGEGASGGEGRARSPGRRRPARSGTRAQAPAGGAPPDPPSPAEPSPSAAAPARAGSGAAAPADSGLDEPVAPPTDADRPPDAAPSASPPPYDPQRVARLRTESREHPAVQQVIRALDAELAEIRVPRES